ncbi:hypothetical protein HZS_452 [Henneguya salminicola]|nr:hypothetical protein HZS_452 [Henneguya salminicola]
MSNKVKEIHHNLFSKALGIFSSSKDNKNSLFMSAFNTTNCMIGSGIIGLNYNLIFALPYAAQKCGLGLSLILSTFAGLLSAYTCLLLTRACVQTGSKSYMEVVEKTLGRVAKFLLSICNILFPSSISIAYGVAIADNLTLVFENLRKTCRYNLVPEISFLQYRLIPLAICLALIIFPISIFKHLYILGKISMISIFFVIFYTIVFMLRTTTLNLKILVLPEHWDFASKGFVQSLSTLFFGFFYMILILAYAVHHNIITLFLTLRKNTFSRFCTSLFGSTIFTTIVYYICMISGFLSFSGVLRSNLLQNYCVNDLLIMWTRIIFTITLLATYPFQCLFKYIWAIFELIKTRIVINRWIRYLTTFLLILIYGISSYFATSVGSIIEIGGSLTASPLILIFPPLIYMRAGFGSLRISAYERLALWIIVLFGFIMMILGTILAVMDLISGEVINIPKYWCLNH